MIFFAVVGVILVSIFGCVFDALKGNYRYEKHDPHWVELMIFGLLVLAIVIVLIMQFFNDKPIP